MGWCAVSTVCFCLTFYVHALSLLYFSSVIQMRKLLFKHLIIDAKMGFLFSELGGLRSALQQPEMAAHHAK